MQNRFETIIKHLIGTQEGILARTGLDISGQFTPNETSYHDRSRNINAAFLILLSGDSHPMQGAAKAYFSKYSEDAMVVYYEKVITLIHEEISDESAISELYEMLESPQDVDPAKLRENIWNLFFPEACGILENREQEIEKLRAKRKISITKLNENPIKNISKEMLFTSNILITLPPASKEIDDLGFSPTLAKTLKEVSKEPQKYWYDHPIQMGVEIEKNEAIYGLVGLNEAIAFEKKRGTLGADDKINCLLSVSVTHDGLTKVAKEYLEGELKKVKNIENLNIFVITEDDASQIIDELLLPAAKHFGLSPSEALAEIFGVDGEYGRHYSLLKAIAALWQVFVDEETRATFKFDLDQIFPQSELVEQSGLSAFEHFKTPLWGAEGKDSEGAEVEMGMIAGALVNQSDIDKSLFTPDVTFPTKEPKGSQLVFYSTLPQALSTQAEMMLRYDSPEFDGVKNCIQRIHVTGGTNGIMIESLRKHRPFTPSFIGRAEDQAYILSALFCEEKKSLRYVHKDGLIMRHDKHAFAQESIEAAHLGKMVGDYVRILYFSHYVKTLPWDTAKIKNAIDPFTGSFVSHIPFTVVALRMALEAANFFEKGDDEEGDAFLKLGIQRVDETMQLLSDDAYLAGVFEREKSGWGDYYDILDVVEKGLNEKDDFVVTLQEKAKVLMQNFKI